MARAGSLTVDTFWTLIPAGWSITTGSRYDPTHLDGFTPGGRAFVLDMTSADDGTMNVTITVAGRTRSGTFPAATWDGQATWDRLISTWQLLPANQR